MSWKDDLRPASFRGVAFFVDVSSFTTGRKVALHEFPDRDLSYPEDIGKIPRDFKLDAHILGDDYFDVKRALIRAAEKEGPGELVHPYYGTIQVQCGPLTVNEDTGQGRIAALTFKFFHAGDNKFPDNIQDKASVLDERAESAIQASKNEFDSKFSIDGLPGFGVQTSRDQVADAAAKFTNSTEGLVTLSEEVSKLAFNSRNLVAETDDLLQAPGDLSSRLLDSFSLLEDAIPKVEGKTTAIQVFRTFGSANVGILGQTPTRIKQRENQQLFDTFMKQVAIAKEAQYAVDTDFDNIDDANAARESISALIEEQLTTTESDDIYQNFQALNAVLIRAVPDVDNDLPNIETFTPKTTTNSLVVVYDLFENLNSEEDLIKRNKIKNPASINQGDELEVIDVGRS